VICFKVESLVEHPHHWQLAAQWSFEAWMHEFLSDTVQTYLDQYALAACEPEELIEVFAAIDSQDNLLGVATLVDDDELPDAPEPGPWLAAVFVKPEARNLQIGSELVTNVVDRARELGYQKIYLYTEHAEDWYRKKGWIKIRDIVFLGLHHTVMQLELS
jgi:N-acetylglutamate synthase-like GNAT family acetyltransferase